MDKLKKSIVHEFAILYSNRINQKDKKWIDGKLKFYEFNRKVEVFNVDGNLIKSDFFTEKYQCNLEEGNTFVLPNNGLLIQVDCFIRSSERDISDLFKRDLSTSLARKQKSVTKFVSKQEAEAYTDPKVKIERDHLIKIPDLASGRKRRRTNYKFEPPRIIATQSGKEVTHAPIVKNEDKKFEEKLKNNSKPPIPQESVFSNNKGKSSETGLRKTGSLLKIGPATSTSIDAINHNYARKIKKEPGVTIGHKNYSRPNNSRVRLPRILPQTTNIFQHLQQ